MSRGLPPWFFWKNPAEFEKKARAAAPPPPMIRIGKIRYDPEFPLGSGCFGEVYKGLYGDDESTQVEVAVKKVEIDECGRISTRREAQSMLSFKHKTVIRLLAMEEDPTDSFYVRFMYLAMEMCCGSLKDYISGKLEISLADSDWKNYDRVEIKILSEVTLGLEYIHSEGYVHKDLKADNILVHLEDPEGGLYRMKLADFGLVRRLDGGLVQPGSGYTGNAAHRAPERDNLAYGTTSMDTFGLGILFHEVLTKGAHPFGAADEEKLENIKNGQFSLDLLVAKDRYDAVDVIDKMIAYSPSQRPSAEEILKHPLLMQKPSKDEFINGCIVVDLLQIQLHPRWTQRLNTWAECFDPGDALALKINLHEYTQSSDPLKSLTIAFSWARGMEYFRQERFRLFERNIPCFFYLAYLCDKQSKDIQGSSPLHKAVDYNNSESLSELLEKGDQDCRINFQDHEGKTPICLAAQVADVSIVELLAAKGAKLDIADKNGFTPLHRAVIRGGIDVVDTLLKLKPPLETRASKQKATPLHYAAAEDRPRIVELLLDAGALVNVTDQRNWTPLHYAAQCGSEQNADALIKAGADVNAQKYDLQTALHMAVIQCLAKKPNTALIRLLLDKGADPDMSDSLGTTPLHIAAEYLAPDILETLLAKTKEIDKPNSVGRTALHYAVENQRLENAALLLQKGANVNAVSALNEAAIHMAVRREKSNPTLIKLLLEKGAKPDMPDKYGRTPLHVAAKHLDSDVLGILLGKTEDINKRDRLGCTALHHAVKESRSDNTELFTNAGADNSLNDDETLTQLQREAKKHEQILTTVGLLLKKGANPDMPDHSGVTSLHLAAQAQFCSSCY